MIISGQDGFLPDRTTVAQLGINWAPKSCLWAQLNRRILDIPLQFLLMVITQCSVRLGTITTYTGGCFVFNRSNDKPFTQHGAKLYDPSIGKLERQGFNVAISGDGMTIASASISNYFYVYVQSSSGNWTQPGE